MGPPASMSSSSPFFASLWAGNAERTMRPTYSWPLMVSASLSSAASPSSIVHSSVSAPPRQKLDEEDAADEEEGPVEEEMPVEEEAPDEVPAEKGFHSPLSLSLSKQTTPSLSSSNVWTLARPFPFGG